MSNTWCRLHNSIRHDPKIQRLPLRARWALVMLWTLASENDGVIPEDDLPFELRLKPYQCAEVINLLLGLRLLERESGAVGAESGQRLGRLVPHNWHGRQYVSDNSTTRTRAYRERERSRNVTVTPPDTDTDTDTDTDKKKNLVNGHAVDPLDASFSRAFENYNKAANALGLPKAERLTSTRRTKLKARLREHELSGWNRALQNVAEMPFCCGENDRGWRINLDWMLEPRNFTKLLERAYERPERPADGI